MCSLSLLKWSSPLPRVLGQPQTNCYCKVPKNMKYNTVSYYLLLCLLIMNSAFPKFIALLRYWRSSYKKCYREKATFRWDQSNIIWGLCLQLTMWKTQQPSNKKNPPNNYLTGFALQWPDNTNWRAGWARGPCFQMKNVNCRRSSGLHRRGGRRAAQKGSPA